MNHGHDHTPAQILPEVDAYIGTLPSWQQEVCMYVRRLIHEADPEITEQIKFTNRPYFTLQGNICALQATKDHVNVFIYDPIAPDPTNLINQGQQNATARSIQLYQGDVIDPKAFKALVKAVADNNRAGGWRKLRKS
jgi:hypothetical protein